MDEEWGSIGQTIVGLWSRAAIYKGLQKQCMQLAMLHQTRPEYALVMELCEMHNSREMADT